MSTNPAQVTPTDGSGEGAPDARQLRSILIAVSMALMAVIASVSGLNVAQTEMAVDLETSQTTVLWIKCDPADGRLVEVAGPLDAG